MSTTDFGLFTGKTGAVLLYFYLSRYLNESYYEIAEKSLMEIMGNLQKTSIIFSHCGGYSGICWTLMHLKEYEYIDIDASILDDTDEYLFNDMIYALENDSWDFLHGASGIPFCKKEKDELTAYFSFSIRTFDAHKITLST